MSKAQKEAVLASKPSAYRSMQLSALGLSKPNKDNKGALKTWVRENWINLNALKDMGIYIPCGQKYPGQTEPTVCRPRYKVGNKTPSPLADDLTKRQIEKAIEIKKKGLRINWKDL
jgi:hypothetical protein